MKVALVRVGIDSGSGGMQGPLFADGSFEFIPIPDGEGINERKYGNTLGRHGRLLVDYFPSRMMAKMIGQSMHVDPEFESFTYGDPTPPKAGLRRLEPGDLLVFYAGLEGWDWASEPALYIVGYFDVQKAGMAGDFVQSELERDFCENFHVRHPVIFNRQKHKLVLVKGSPNSRLLEKAVKISGMGWDRSGRPLKVLSPEMQMIFGGFGGKLCFQRSPTRWVEKDFVGTAAAFIRGLQ